MFAGYKAKLHIYIYTHIYTVFGIQRADQISNIIRFFRNVKAQQSRLKFGNFYVQSVRIQV